MSNKRRLRQLNRSSGQVQRQKQTWGQTASLRNIFSRREISAWLARRKDGEK